MTNSEKNTIDKLNALFNKLLYGYEYFLTKYLWETSIDDDEERIKRIIARIKVKRDLILKDSAH